MTEHDLRPPKQQAKTSSHGKWLLALVVLAAVAAGAWYLQHQHSAKPPAAPEPATAQQPAAFEAQPDTSPPPSPPTAMPALPAMEPAQSTPLHPVSVVAASAPSPATGDEVLDQWAIRWLGKPALQYLVLPGLAHHIVATVDNLPRSHAAPRLWPLSPVGGKMLLDQQARGSWIAPANSERYDGVVNFVTGIDPAQAADWYRQAYPVLQQSYEDLGYPGGYFNDRLVAVIDHLLQTPEPTEPLAVDWVQVQGEIRAQQPWLRYEFVDADLQSRSAGQKILLRLGAEHRQQLKAYLQQFRAHIVRQP